MLLILLILISLQLPVALPDPLPVPSFTSTYYKTPPSSSSSVIPAFPEQSSSEAAAATSSSSSSSSSTCQLSLPEDLTALTSSLASPARLCPSLAAILYSAYSSSALSLPPAAASISSLPGLPDLPDDPESCAAEVDRALAKRGVHLPRPNGTCDAAFCLCGVRLRRLTCGGDGGFVADGSRWAPVVKAERRLTWHCRSPGVAGCSRCLTALNTLNPNSSSATSNGECQLMGLTWLLAKNTTLYLPAATNVLAAFMSSPNGNPTSCSVPQDEMPFAVGSNAINGHEESSSVKSSSMNLLLLFVVVFIAL